ncbi:response regulator transcription factor [Cohnella boryungensis]|uniref:Response regulator transcription factor n=1 Tax=Cohnella boryungensis TaxID=768479 RepID=A0ABV8SEC2_9BACL
MMDSKVILVVDDHPSFQKLVTAFLVREGYAVRNALNAAQALAHLELEEPDLILLDIKMPDMDGIELCQKIRNYYHRPILFITGTKQDEEKIKSLQAGGDDCIIKPFDPLDLVLRVKANLRWSALLEGNDNKAHILNFPGLQINLERKLVMLHQKPVVLSAKEFQMLIAFAKRPNQVFDPEQLYRLVWKDEFNYTKETVKVHIHNLRKKIEINPGKPVYIITVNGLGYKFNPYGAVQ